LSKDQEASIDHLRVELERAEGQLRNANENELPEEGYRVLVDQKRNELTHLMQVFRDENDLKKNNKTEHYEDQRQSGTTSRRQTLHSSAGCRDLRSNVTKPQTFLRYDPSSTWGHKK